MALLYEDENRRTIAEAQYIVKALAQGQFCIYGSVDMHYANSAASFASKITGYDNFVKQKDLLVIDLKPFYDDALEGRLDIFERLRARIEDELEKRTLAQKSTKTLVVADAACNMVKNGHFAMAAQLEAWWQRTYTDWTEKGLDITIICTHPSLVLQENAANEHLMNVMHEHSLALELKNFVLPDLLQPLASDRIVVEAEPDVAMSVFSTMESVLGAMMFKVIMEEIERKYLGNEMDARQCLIRRPELFERAFCAVVGSAGRSILLIICKKVQSQLQIENDAPYKRYGDLEKFIRRAKRSTNSTPQLTKHG